MNKARGNVHNIWFYVFTFQTFYLQLEANKNERISHFASLCVCLTIEEWPCAAFRAELKTLSICGRFSELTRGDSLPGSLTWSAWCSSFYFFWKLYNKQMNRRYDMRNQRRGGMEIRRSSSVPVFSVCMISCQVATSWIYANVEKQRNIFHQQASTTYRRLLWYQRYGERGDFSDRKYRLVHLVCPILNTGAILPLSG